MQETDLIFEATFQQNQLGVCKSFIILSLYYDATETLHTGGII